MSEADAPIRRDDAAGHLELLRALARELENAMNAMVANDIAGLEDSVSRQEALCSRLASFAEAQNAAARAGTGAAAGVDPELQQQVRAATAAVDALNRRYAILLQHASGSVAMMVSLFRSFQGEIGEGTGARGRHATWSCQV